jgi:ribosomal protein L3 glutamine methyltransferase
LLDEVADHLAPDGVLVAEVGANRKTLERAFPRLPFTWLATSAGQGLVFLLRRTEFAARRQ